MPTLIKPIKITTLPLKVKTVSKSIVAEFGWSGKNILLKK